jgi:hypothetical protein
MKQEFDLPIPPPYRMAPEPDHGPRNMSMIAAAIGLGLVVLAGAWSFGGSSSHDIPYIEADTSPVRIKPVNPGGQQFIGQSDDGGNGDIGHMDAPSEAPNVTLLHERMKDGGVSRATPAPETTDTDESSPGTETPQPEAAKPKGLTPSAPRAEKPTAQPRKMAAPEHREAPAAKEAIKAPKSSKSLEAAKPAAKNEPKSHPTGSLQVQLTAASSEEAARTEWARLKKLAPDQLAGKQPQISKVERNGKVYYRLRTTGFSDSARAASFCNDLKSKHAACSVASF